MDRCIDLHCHSVGSDGTWTATQIVQEAKRIGLAALCISEHDTTSTWAEAQGAAAGSDLELVPGIEISGKWSTEGTLHILGYLLDPAHAGLQKGLAEFRAQRDSRNPKIIEKLRALGMDITYEEVLAEAKGGVVGRPHMATVLKNKGYVPDNDTAFVRYLKRDGKAYVEKDSFPPEKAIGMIREAGGVAVLAHPKYLFLKGKKEKDFFARMVEGGLGGVETYYSSHSRKETRHYLDLAKEFDLIPTGGSDFHGDNKPDIKLGTGMGGLKVPYEVLEQLKEKAGRASRSS